ncbi:DUF5691 domain-containing protein [Streptomyces sp. P6-2-1]|uniref:DUF5691 domain-containing protein n=1 Tax=Streptomyces sp. P6-2-1 TaxID=3422591 RepID=UPI003D36BFF9
MSLTDTSPSSPLSPSGPSPAPVPDWEDLLTTALLGTDRRPFTGADGASGPGALLDEAALRTVRRRAGLVPAAAAPLPVPVPPETRPPLPEAARRRLGQLLGARGDQRGGAPDLAELLPQWLERAHAHGYAPPPEHLPALLDAARGRTDLRPAVLGFAGVRGRWLAEQNREWSFVRRTAVAPPVREEAPGTRGDEERLWGEGLFAERVALLARVRAADPARALALLGTTWAKERAEDRLLFLDSLRPGLGAHDEAFLEAALDDRSRNVRALAAELLSSLTDSAFAARMAERARACVGPGAEDGAAADTAAVDGDAAAGAIVVDAPRACDAAMEHDGVVAKPPSGRGERAWWFGQVVDAAPLAVWREHFGGASPAELVARPVAGGWREELHAAWCRAAVRQGDAEWSRALLGSPAGGEHGATALAERARLLAALPAGERAAWVAGFLAANGLSEAFQLLSGCATPWPAELGRAVVDALNIARDAGSYPWSFSGVMGLAERCLDPAEAPHLEKLIGSFEEHEDTGPAAGLYWTDVFHRLLATLRLRAEMRAELDGEPPAGNA